ncbi:MAG: ATP-binding cassette domain-containing protein [Halobacteriovoraceae bacterium]|nr:ATP-binding cassette domain-containing protein [Halobacteriovoraceae bacterium]
MNSISSCENHILSVTDLNVIYNINFYKNTSIRERFVNILNNPMEHLLPIRDTLHAVKNISLKLKKGDRLGVLGVNGSGKSSLCKCIAEIIRPYSGKIVRSGTMRSIFESTICFNPELTGEENLKILARLIYTNESEESIEEIVRESLDFSEIGEFRHTPFMNYSMGMKTRICLSLVSAKPCDLLIMDEVFSGADEFFQNKITSRVLDMIHQSGSVIFVSHAPEQIKLACNKIIVIKAGSIVFEGDVDQGIAFYKQNKNPGNLYS